MHVIEMSELDLRDKIVLIREDFNVPIDNGHITSDARLLAALPTIKQAHQAGAKIILISHLGRPEEGKPQSEFSLAPVAKRLTELLKTPVRFVPDWLEGIKLDKGEIILGENVRFNIGEKKNDEKLSRRMASLCDVFVMDAFATAHRAEASTVGVAQFAPVACAGPLLITELKALTQALDKPAHPLVAIVGGSKVSTKLLVLESLLNKVDQLIVGGGIANTFLAATGHAVGKSLYEQDLVPEAKRLLALANSRGIKLILPTDVVVAKKFDADATPEIKDINHVLADDMILDVGPKTAASYANDLKQAGTILWNGPVGVFEFPAFATGTNSLAQAIAESSAYSLAGGGDTLVAIEKWGIADKISYISTGGGAFLEFVEGKVLPAVAILQQRASTINL